MKITIDTRGLTLQEARSRFEREFLEHRYREHGGNMTATARSVGMARAALDKKMRTMGVQGLSRAILKTQASLAGDMLKPGAARELLESRGRAQGAGTRSRDR